MSCFSQNTRRINAVIKVENNHNILSVVAEISNPTDKTIKNLKYELFIERVSKGNNVSHTKQAGAFVLKPNTKIALSRQSINTDVDSPVFLHLLIKKMGMVVAKEHKKVVLKKANSKYFIEVANIDDVEYIRQTDTRVSSRFSDFFENTNEIKGISYPFIVTFKDEGCEGSCPKLSIYVGDNLVYKFRYLKKVLYLRAAVQEINKRLLRYHANGELYTGVLSY